jgi:hypothetical protein
LQNGRPDLNSIDCSSKGIKNIGLSTISVNILIIKIYSYTIIISERSILVNIRIKNIYFECFLSLKSIPALSVSYTSDWQLYPDLEKVSPFSFSMHVEKSQIQGPAYKTEESTGIF